MGVRGSDRGGALIRFEEAKIALAKAIYDLLTESPDFEWFSVSAITKKSQLQIGSAFVSRVMTLSREEDDIFERFDGDGEDLWTLAKEGFELVESQALLFNSVVDFVPASDRVVRFNHNSPEALEISAKIAELSESLRGANDPEIDEQERSRIHSALEVSKQIWSSGQFKLIQLKVGVLLAVEDAALLLAKTSKHVAAALLVDAIKAFAKNHFHADLDSI